MGPLATDNSPFTAKIYAEKEKREKEAKKKSKKSE